MTGTAWDRFSGETFALVNNNSQLRVEATNAQSQPVFTQVSTTGDSVRLLGSDAGNTFYRVPAPPKITLNPGTPGAAPTAVADTYTTALAAALNIAVADGVLKNDTIRRMRRSPLPWSAPRPGHAHAERQWLLQLHA
jgi:hypothetical protein